MNHKPINHKIATAFAAGAMLVAGATSAFAATEEERAAIMGSCAADLGMNTSECNCIADRAENELDEATYSLFAATIADPAAAGMKAMELGVTQEQMLVLGDFMTETPGICAGQ